MFPYLSHYDINVITKLFTVADKDGDGYVSSHDIRSAGKIFVTEHKVNAAIYFPESSMKDVRLSLVDLLQFNNAYREQSWID